MLLYIAREEGFNDIAVLFDNIGSIEKVHSDRFKKYADRLENGTLFKDNTQTLWMCTNCGFIYEGTEALKACPVCTYPQGYFIRFEETQFE